MAKITISRIFEISKYLTTQSGKDLEDALRYVSQFSELTLRALRNQLTFGDNLDCEIRQVSVRTNTATVITPVQTNRRAVRITIDQAIDQTFYVVTAFGWKYNNDGKIVILVKFTDFAGTAPDPLLDVNLSLVIHFG